MTRTLITLATLGLLASGATVAATIAEPNDSRHSNAVIPVQYYGGGDRSDQRIADIDEREARIRARIQRGTDDGTLTEWEARRLYRELGDIRAKERALRADGRLDAREAAALNRDLDRLAEDVREERRDEQRRY